MLQKALAEAHATQSKVGVTRCYITLDSASVCSVHSPRWQCATQDQVSRKVALTEDMLEDAINAVRSAILTVGLPEEHLLLRALETATNEVHNSLKDAQQHNCLC